MVKWLILLLLSLFSLISARAEDLNRHLISFDALGGMMRAWGPSYAYAVYASEGKSGTQTHLFLGTGIGHVYEDNQLNPGSPRIPLFLRVIVGKSAKMELELGMTYGGVIIEEESGRIPHRHLMAQPKYSEIDTGLGLAWSNTIGEYVYWRFGVGYIHGRLRTAYYSAALGVWF